MNLLIDDKNRTITCPRCEETQSEHDFVTLGMSPRYAGDLVPIRRCKQCNHLFALKENNCADRSS